MAEQLKIPSASLRFLDSGDTENGPENRGQDKWVYKAEYGGLVVAAKYIRDYSFIRERLPKAGIANHELSAYQELKKSPLGIYVPESYGLIINTLGQTEGLVVEWIDGARIGKYVSDRVGYSVRAEELDELEHLVYETARTGVFISTDMLNVPNLRLSLGRSPRIWFAECATYNDPSIDSFMKDVKFELSFARKHVE